MPVLIECYGEFIDNVQVDTCSSRHTHSVQRGGRGRRRCVMAAISMRDGLIECSLVPSLICFCNSGDVIHALLHILGLGTRLELQQCLHAKWYSCSVVFNNCRVRLSLKMIAVFNNCRVRLSLIMIAVFNNRRVRLSLIMIAVVE